jgi:nucleoid DNA-binding protein
LRTKAGSSNETENRKMKMTEKTSKPSVEQEAGQISVAALLEQMQQGNPDLLKGLPKPKAAELLRSAFKQVKDILAQTQEGKVAFGGLGQFRVRQVEKEVAGKKVIRTQIVFKSVEPGKGKKKGAGQA